MKLAIKTRDNLREDYLYEVHRAGCSHLKKEFSQVFITDKYNSPEELIKSDMCEDLSFNDYKIMPCVNS